MSSLKKTPGGGIRTLLFMVNKWFGVSGSGKSGEDISFKAIGLEFTIAWTSFRSVRNVSSSN